MGEVAYGCCIGSTERFTRYVAPLIHDRNSVTVTDASSIAQAYNDILMVHTFQETSAGAVVLVHDDLEVVNRDVMERAVLTAFGDESVALVGVAGSRACTSLAWWESDVMGRQRIEDMTLDFGVRCGDVTGLEGSFIALSPWAVRHVRFDTAYPGFHGYDCDIAFTVRALGKRAVVRDIDTFHHVNLGFKTTESAASWHQANNIFRRKWNL